MTVRTAMPLLLALALGACAGTDSPWVKEGAGEDRVRADRVACRAQAEAALARRESFTSDIREATRRGDQPTREIVTKTRDLEVARLSERLFQRCMAARGYLRAKT